MLTDVNRTFSHGHRKLSTSQLKCISSSSEKYVKKTREIEGYNHFHGSLRPKDSKKHMLTRKLGNIRIRKAHLNKLGRNTSNKCQMIDRQNENEYGHSSYRYQTHTSVSQMIIRFEKIPVVFTLNCQPSIATMLLINSRLFPPALART